MSIAQYHGKVYRSVRTGIHYTKTPNGNVLYKHPVLGPKVWTPSPQGSMVILNALIKGGDCEVVNDA